MNWSHKYTPVIPAKAGIHQQSRCMDPRLNTLAGPPKWFGEEGNTFRTRGGDNETIYETSSSQLSAISYQVRKIALGLFLLFSLTVPTLSASAESIRFWTALKEPDQSVMAELVARYNQQHSTTVDYRNFASRAELYQALQGNDLPDLALIGTRWIERLRSRLVPAEDVLSKAGDMVRAVARADTFKPVWSTTVIDGKSYAIPFSAETAALVINPRHFKKVPRIATIAQLQKVAMGLKKGPVKVTPIMLPLSWEKPELGELWTRLAIAMTKSPKLRNQDDLASRPLTLHDEMAALNLWWNWMHRTQIASVAANPLPEGFVLGAVWFLTPRESESLNEANVTEPLPRVKRPWGFLHVDALAFFDTDKGWDLANYLTDYAQEKYWSMKTPTVPVNKQVYLSPDYLQAIDANRPWMRIYIAAFNQSPEADFPEDRMDAVGGIVMRSLQNELKVQDGALKVHESLFGNWETKK